MVFIEYLGRDFQVQLVFGRFFPGKIQKPVQVGADNGCLGCVRMHHFQPFKLFFCLLFRILGHLFLFQGLVQVFYLLGIGIFVAEFAF